MALRTNAVKGLGLCIAKSITLGYNSEKKSEWAMANLTLDCGNGNEQIISMFSNKLTADGKENKGYNAIMTIMEEYNSLNSTIKNKVVDGDKAEAKVDKSTTVNNREECDFVSFEKGCTMQMNRYMSEGNGLQESIRLSARFVNRETNVTTDDLFIEGNLLGMVSKGACELVNEETDERYVTFELTVPTYNSAYGTRDESVSIEKFPLVVRLDEDITEDALDYCLEVLSSNVVVEVGVVPTNELLEQEEKPKERMRKGFGKIPEISSSTLRRRELRVIGVEELEKDEWEEDNAFNMELFEKGLEEFEKNLEEMKNNQKSARPTTRGFGERKTDNGGNKNLPF